MYLETTGDALKETIVASSNSDVQLILPVGNFTIYCEIWDTFGAYTEVTVGTAVVSIYREAESQYIVCIIEEKEWGRHRRSSS